MDKRQDVIVRGLLMDGAAQIVCASTRGMTNRAIALHGLSPVCAAAMGRAMAAAAMMMTDFKNQRAKLSVHIAGGGAAGALTVAADAALNIRGCIDEPLTELPLNPRGKLDVSGALGKNGTLTVIVDSGEREPYSGKVDLVSGEVAEDVAQYLAQSQQQPCAVLLGVLIGKNRRCLSAGGLILRPLPFCDESALAALEAKVRGMGDISARLNAQPPGQLLETLFADCGYVPVSEHTPRYRCNCGKRKINGTVRSLGKDDALNLLAQRGSVEVTCHFCNKTYRYGKEDIEKLFSSNRE